MTIQDTGDGTSKVSNGTAAARKVGPLKRQNAVKSSIGTLGASRENPQPSLLDKVRFLFTKSSSDSTNARDSISTSSPHNITPSSKESGRAKGLNKESESATELDNTRGSESARGSDSIRESPSKAPSNKGMRQRMSQIFRRSSLPKNNLETTSKEETEFEQADRALEAAVSNKNLLFDPKKGPPHKDLVAAYDEPVKKAQEKRDRALSKWKESINSKLTEAAIHLEKTQAELESAIHRKNEYLASIEDPTTSPSLKANWEIGDRELDQEIQAAREKWNEAQSSWDNLKDEESNTKNKQSSLDRVKNNEARHLERETFKIDLSSEHPDINVLIKTPIGFEEMMNVGKGAHVEENVIFLKYIAEYKALVNEFNAAKTPPEKEAKWNEIQGKYAQIMQNCIDVPYVPPGHVSENPAIEINLPADVKSKLIDPRNSLTTDNMATLFDEAFTEITLVTNRAIAANASGAAFPQMKALRERYL